MEPSQRAQAIIDTNKHDNGHQYSVERKAALDAWGGYVQADEVANAIEAAKAAGADGLNILASPLWHSELPNIVKQAAALRLPVIYQWPDIAEQGGLAHASSPSFATPRGSSPCC